MEVEVQAKTAVEVETHLPAAFWMSARAPSGRTLENKGVRQPKQNDTYLRPTKII